jgi:TRAP-type C4-dicarboxylate transport system substrate-binding protein
MKLRSGVAAAAAAIALLAGSAAAQAEDEIRSLIAFPRQLGFAKSYLEWLDKINPQAKGTFQITVIGGPEAIPTFEQAKALKSGVVDMNLTPSSYYPGEVPEIEALVGGNMSPWEARANGGFDLMNQIQQKKMNAYLLAWVEYGPRFNFYLKNQPKTRADGLPDFSGVKLRGAPAYREFMAAMGGTFVNIAAPEVYTALDGSQLGQVHQVQDHAAVLQSGHRDQREPGQVEGAHGGHAREAAGDGDRVGEGKRGDLDQAGRNRAGRAEETRRAGFHFVAGSRQEV